MFVAADVETVFIDVVGERPSSRAKWRAVRRAEEDLVASVGDADVVDFKAQQGGEASMARHWVDGNGDIVPVNGFVIGDVVSDFDRLVPETGPVVAGWVFQQVGKLLAGPRRTDGSFEDPVAMLIRGLDDSPSGPVNTTIGLVATDAKLSKEDTNYLAGVSHDGLALTIRPCHTVRDGDTMFAVATGRNESKLDLTSMGAAAVEVTAQAVIRAIQQATGLGGIPSLHELKC